MSKIGVPNYSQNNSKYPKRNYFRPEDGDNFFRVLPPFGAMAEQGVWMVYGQSHWLRNAKGQARVIACIADKDHKTKMFKVRCPICDECERRKETGKAMIEEQKLTGEAKKAAEKMINDWDFSHSRQSRYYMNALNREGAIGRLEIKTKHKQALIPKIKELSEKGLDPVGLGGVELNFKTSGTGNEKLFIVEEARENVDATTSRIKIAPLTDEVAKRMETEAYDLKDMFRVLDAATMKRIVDSDFNGEVVDAILNAPTTKDVAAAQAEQEAAEQDDPSDIPAYKPAGFVPTAQAGAPEQSVQVSAPVQQFVPPPAPTPTPAPVVQTTTAPVAAPTTAPAVNSATSKDAFMALFGPKK